jgi:hypothetical protein
MSLEHGVQVASFLQLASLLGITRGLILGLGPVSRERR